MIHCDVMIYRDVMIHHDVMIHYDVIMIYHEVIGVSIPILKKYFLVHLSYLTNE